MAVDQQGKPGRPTKYERETVDRLLAGLADGLPIKSACIIAGIGVSTLSDWRERYPELEERMADAREKARLKMLQRIKRAAKDDWRAAADQQILGELKNKKWTGNPDLNGDCVTAFIKAERAWIAFRDAESDLANVVASAESGHAGAEMAFQRSTELTEERIKSLQQFMQNWLQQNE
jgi:uncharacterized protein YecT (DUF1311 family)